MLLVQGNVDALAEGVAIVGTRNCCRCPYWTPGVSNRQRGQVAALQRKILDLPVVDNLTYCRLLRLQLEGCTGYVDDRRTFTDSHSKVHTGALLKLQNDAPFLNGLKAFGFHGKLILARFKKRERVVAGRGRCRRAAFACGYPHQCHLRAGHKRAR